MSCVALAKQGEVGYRLQQAPRGGRGVSPRAFCGEDAAATGGLCNAWQRADAASRDGKLAVPPSGGRAAEAFPCRYKKQTTVEYALRHIGTPVGVAQWPPCFARALPKELMGSLPSVEEIEKELGNDG